MACDRDLRCLVIVPAFNEADAIAGVIADLRRHVPTYDIVVVDDGSTDGTADVARRAAAGAGAADRVRVLSLPFNLGIGGAVQTGYRYAALHGYDVAVQVDGDGQHPANQIPQLVETLRRSGANLAIGSRFVYAQAGSEEERSDDEEPDGSMTSRVPNASSLPPDTAYLPPPSRMMGIRVLRVLIRLLTGQRCTDPTSGLRAADRRLIRAFAHWYPDDYPEPEVVVLLHRAGFRFVEAPAIMSARVAGQTSIPFHRGVFYVVKVSAALLLDMVRHPWPKPKPGAERSEAPDMAPDLAPDPGTKELLP